MSAAKFTLFVLVAICFCAPPCASDVVYLKNGDRVAFRGHCEKGDVIRCNNGSSRVSFRTEDVDRISTEISIGPAPRNASDARAAEEERGGIQPAKRRISVEIIDNGDGTISDFRTSLMWQQHCTSGKLTWEEACKYCNYLSFAGYGDWRAPSVADYKRLGVSSGGTIAEMFANYSLQFWTSDRCTFQRSHATCISFDYFSKYNGFVSQPYSNHRRARRYIRCVRQ
jgi:hypothetical protein